MLRQEALEGTILQYRACFESACISTAAGARAAIVWNHHSKQWRHASITRQVSVRLIPLIPWIASITSRPIARWSRVSIIGCDEAQRKGLRKVWE